MRKYIFLLFPVLLFCFQSSSAQVIQAPDIQCVIDSNANITIYWANPAANPCGAFQQYTIYASSTGPNGPYSPVAVTDQAATSYTLVNYLTNTKRQWYFYMEANYNCPGATVLQSDTVSNQRPPIPNIIDVNVVNGKAVFTWEPDSAPQTKFYIIYYYLPNGLASSIDTVYGRFNTTYTDLKGDPTTSSLVYTISAVDSCGKISSYSSKPHNTILMAASITQCQRQVNMSWNAYNNWPQGVKEYQVWVSRNDSAFKMDGIADTTTRQYAYTNFNDGDTICVVVRAVSAADTTVVSNSNVVCMRASIVQPPAFNYITNVTVDDNNDIAITWNIDSMGQLLNFSILQSNNGLSYNPIDQYGVPSPLYSFNSYLDSLVSPENSPYYYKVVAFDSCQNQYPSDYAETVNLKGELYDYYVANLTWNQLVISNAKVVRYNLYRDFGAGYTQIRSFSPGSTSADTLYQYVDSLQQFLQDRGVFCYRIEAVYDINLPNGYNATLSSWSNVQCIIHRPIIYIPNAFAPNGVNTIFKPTIIYGEPKNYQMVIYNRWGGEVFTSQDPNKGWDGTDHNSGKESPQGGYAYFIQFTADDGVVVERQGVLMLVR